MNDRLPMFLERFIRNTVQEWRSPELRVLGAALVIAVAAVAAVGFFTDRVDRGMTQQATTLLGGDIAVRSNVPIPEEWLAEADLRGLYYTRSATMPSVLFTPADDSLMVSVRAVDTDWPLHGTAEILSHGESRRTSTGPTPGNAWGDGNLLEALQLDPGMNVDLGFHTLVLSAQLLIEPDRGSSFFDIAPRLLIHYDDLEASGLIGPGSRVRYQFLVAGPTSEILDFESWLQPRLVSGQRLLDLEDANPELQEAVSRARRFLGLASLMAVLLAGAAIAVAAHHYAQQRADAAAILRALGARRSTVLRTFLTRVVTLAIVASLIGLFFGYFAQFMLAKILEAWLVTELPPPSWRPMVAGLGVGLITAGGFALPGLLRIGEVSPLRVLQRNLGVPPASVWFSALLALAALGSLLYWQSADPVLALWILLGTGVALSLLGLIGWGMIFALRPLRQSGGLALRFGLANLSRRGGLSAIQLVAFSLGILALLLLAIVRVDLLSSWEESLPDSAHNLFFINIQPGQEQDFADRVAASGIPRPAMDNMIRGRLTEINGRPIAPGDYAEDRTRRLLEREFNLSAMDSPPAHNQILSGSWFGGDEHARLQDASPTLDSSPRDRSPIGEWSVESGLAERLGLEVGDVLTFLVAGTPVTGTVTSLRDVDWNRFQVNFFVIGNTEMLAAQPRTYITSLFLPEELEREKNQWLREFPAVTAIDVTALLAQIRNVIQQATRAVEYVFLFTLLAGLTVLYAAVQTTRDLRRRETALLRTLGARQQQIRRALFAEFGTLGLLSGLLASIIATFIGALLAWQVFDFAYSFNPMLFLFGMGGGMLGIGLAGWLGTREVLQHPPLHVLRGPE